MSATDVPASNCDNNLLPKKRSLADPRIAAPLLPTTRKSKRRKSQSVRFAANVAEDSQDDYDERDTECDDEEVDEEYDNDEENRENKDTKGEVKAPVIKDVPVKEEVQTVPVPPSEESLQARVASIRAGWTLASVGRLTIGELFLMVSQNILFSYLFLLKSLKLLWKINVQCPHQRT